MKYVWPCLICARKCDYIQFDEQLIASNRRWLQSIHRKRLKHRTKITQEIWLRTANKKHKQYLEGWLSLVCGYSLSITFRKENWMVRNSSKKLRSLYGILRTHRAPTYARLGWCSWWNSNTEPICRSIDDISISNDSQKFHIVSSLFLIVSINRVQMKKFKQSHAWSSRMNARAHTHS